MNIWRKKISIQMENQFRKKSLSFWSWKSITWLSGFDFEWYFAHSKTTRNTGYQATVETVGIPVESAPKKAEVDLTANKVIAIVFWHANDILHFDYFQKGEKYSFPSVGTFSNLDLRFSYSTSPEEAHIFSSRYDSRWEVHFIILFPWIRSNSFHFSA